MAERPILFAAPMILALLSGRKTVTRRLLKPQPADVEFWLGGKPSNSRDGHPTMRDATGKGWAACGPFACPYGQPGDRLWCKESLARGFMPNLLTGEPTSAAIALYRADGAEVLNEHDFNLAWQWKRPVLPSIHMPRWASRLTLEVVSVRTERLHDITEEDARAEGVNPVDDPFQEGREYWECYEPECVRDGGCAGVLSARKSFLTLWRSINGPESWDANPWVWRVEFRRVEGTR